MNQQASQLVNRRSEGCTKWKVFIGRERVELRSRKSELFQSRSSSLRGREGSSQEGFYRKQDGARAY